MSTDTTGIGTEITNVSTGLDHDALKSIKSFDDALALLGAINATPTDVTEYGHGFEVVKKSRLVNVPFIILEWRFNTDDASGRTFVSIMAVTRDGQKVIFNDGSTGILAQVVRITADRAASGATPIQGGVACPYGLTASTYQTKDAAGDTIEATTYYLAESAPAR